MQKSFEVGINLSKSTMKRVQRKIEDDRVKQYKRRKMAMQK